MSQISQTPKYRRKLPQLDGGMFLTDGGLETTLIFHEGWDLPVGEAFILVDSERGWIALRDYFDRYVPLAIKHRAGFVLESPTWRANPDWAEKAGYDRRRLTRVNAASIDLMREVRAAYETQTSPMPISGCIGPCGDGYQPGDLMTAAEAQSYHAFQTDIFAETGADLVTAITMTNIPEALGIANAAARAEMPCVVSFTVETDGRLPSGDRLGHAIETIDREAGRAPVYYMINCAHPIHFGPALEERAAWTQRIRGLRANSSKCSHAELDESPVLDTGDPLELGNDYAALLRRFPHINVLGGCCGTDHRHIASIGDACLTAA